MLLALVAVVTAVGVASLGTAESRPPEYHHYVAMGDSYSAGPFIGTMRSDPEGCARSLQNYPAFLADWLDVATYTDVSCSGRLPTP